MVKVTVEGADMVIANATALVGKARLALENAMKKAGFTVQREAKQLCPVKTGRLRSSISTNWTGSGLSRANIEQGGDANNPQKPSDGVGEASAKGFEVLTGTNVEYAEAVEARSPYLWAAFAIHKTENIRNIQDSVPKAIG